MRTLFHSFVLISAVCALSTAQTSSSSPATNPAASSNPIAIIHTTAGDLHCTLFPKQAPIGVANFIGLASGKKDWTDPTTRAKKHGVPLYDGTIFHRVIPEFMIQGGDPAGNGTGDPGYKFKNETTSDLKFDRPGRLAYANAGPDTNGSQFFITEVPYASLNGGYTIFGQCDEAAVELVKQIARQSRDSNDRPVRPVKITHIEIRNATADTKPASGKGASGTPSASTSPAPSNQDMPVLK